MGAIGYVWSQNEYRVVTQELKRVMEERASLLAEVVRHEIAEYGKVKVDQAELPFLQKESNLIAVYFDSSGILFELAPGSVSLRQEELFQQLYAEHRVYVGSFATLTDAESDQVNIYAAAAVTDSGGKSIGTVCLLLPLGDLETYIQRSRLLLISAIVIVALLGVVVSSLVTNYFSGHFTRAQKLAATVANGDYQARIPESGPTELRALSHYLNQMAEKLQEQFKARRTLLANVTHELARPLAGLQIGIESLRKGAVQNPDLADDLLVSMEQTIRRLEFLIDDIALAAQPETLPIKLDPQPVAVEPFLHGAATRFWSLAELRGVKINVQVNPGLPPVLADERRLNQIIGNLIDNAIKFTPRGGTVRLSAHYGEPGKVSLLVHDSGTGISDEDLKHIFEPFFQGDTGRRIKQGMGLGLSISHQLAEAHGGSLIIENHPDGGTLAKLDLPIAVV